MGRRREERLQTTLPVRVWGMDRNGKPFIQSAHTVDITRMGGRLRDLQCVDKKGDVIRVQHGSQKCNFRVTWVGSPGTSEDGQVGIYSLEPDKYIWGVPLPKRAGPDSYDVKEEVEFLSFGEHPAHGKFAQSGAGVAPALASQGENRPGKKRQHARYVCTGSAEVAPEGSDMPVWCALSDISVAGCYAETTSPLPAHTHVHVHVKTPAIEFHARGVVRTSHPAVGMGLSFGAMNDIDKQRLTEFIAHLQQEVERGTARTKPEPVTGRFEAPAARPPAHDRSLLAAHNRPATATAEKPVSVRIDPALMQRLTQLRSELWEMQASFQPNTIDARILRELKDAVDHARHSLWFAQQWLELQAAKKDPFPLVDKLASERLRSARELNRQLTVDIEAGELQVSMEGIEDLYFAIRDLHTRLSKLLNKA